MRRVALTVALLVASLVGAAPTEEAAGAAPRHLWYRTAVWGTFEETMKGTSSSGLIFENEYVAWHLNSNTATTVSRTGAGLSTHFNLRGRIDAYNRTQTSDSTAVNTGVRCAQRARFGYWARTLGVATASLSGAVQGSVMKPTVWIAGGGEIDVDSTITFTCPDTPGGGSSSTTDVRPLNLSSLTPVLLPPREVFDHGLSSSERIRFGRFFAVQGTFVIAKPLGTLIVGATGTWERRWEIAIFFTPCPDLRC